MLFRCRRSRSREKQRQNSRESSHFILTVHSSTVSSSRLHCMEMITLASVNIVSHSPLLYIPLNLHRCMQSKSPHIPYIACTYDATKGELEAVTQNKTQKSCSLSSISSRVRCDDDVTMIEHENFMKFSHSCVILFIHSISGRHARLSKGRARKENCRRLAPAEEIRKN